MNVCVRACVCACVCVADDTMDAGWKQAGREHVCFGVILSHALSRVELLFRTVTTG